MHVTAVTVGWLPGDKAIPRQPIDDADETWAGNQRYARKLTECSPVLFPESPQNAPLRFGQIELGKDQAKWGNDSFQSAIQHHRQGAIELSRKIDRKLFSRSKFHSHVNNKHRNRKQAP